MPATAIRTMFLTAGVVRQAWSLKAPASCFTLHDDVGWPGGDTARPFGGKEFDFPNGLVATP